MTVKGLNIDMKNNYTNAKKILPECLWNEVSHHFPEGGLMYIPPKSAKGGQIRAQVALLDEEGYTSQEIAQKLERTVRRVNQLKRELGICKPNERMSCE